MPSGVSKLREGSRCSLSVCATVNQGNEKLDNVYITSSGLARDEDEIMGCAKPGAFLFASCISKAAFCLNFKNSNFTAMAKESHL